MNNPKAGDTLVFNYEQIEGYTGIVIKAEIEKNKIWVKFDDGSGGETPIKWTDLKLICEIKKDYNHPHTSIFK